MVYMGFQTRGDYDDLMRDLKCKMQVVAPKTRSLYQKDESGLWRHAGAYSGRVPAAFMGYRHFIDRITKDVDTYLRHRALLAKMGESGKSLNYLLYGPPGTGKTTLIMTFASMHNYPVYVVNRKTRQTVNLSPKHESSPVSVLLFEDFDRCLAQHLDTDAERGGSSYMSDVLNTLDGVNNGDGVVRFFTGNDCKAIFDTPALVNRMSACFHLSFPTREMLRDKLQYLLNGAEEAVTRDASETGDDKKTFLREKILDAVEGRVTLRPFTNFVVRHVFDHNPLRSMVHHVQEELVECHTGNP